VLKDLLAKQQRVKSQLRIPFTDVDVITLTAGILSGITNYFNISGGISPVQQVVI
jgi:hypothetical protein